MKNKDDGKRNNSELKHTWFLMSIKDKISLKYLNVIGLALVVIIGLIIYSNSYNCSFHFDDFDTIVNNTKIHNINDVNAWWNFSQNRPVSTFTFVLNYLFNKVDVRYYHIVNVIIHLINSILVWWLTLLIFSTSVIKNTSILKHKNTIAILMALLFVSHPLATQSVTYIIQRQNLMAFMFYFLSIIFYIKARFLDKKRLLIYVFFIASSIFALLAFLSKENTFTLPVSIFLVEIFFIRNWKISFQKKEYTLYVLLASLLVVIVYLFLQFPLSIFNSLPPSQSMGNSVTITPSNYLFTQFNVIVKYIQLLFLPINQNIDYDFRISKSFFELRTILSFTFLASLVLISILLFKRYRLISFGILWFFVTLSIESSFIPITDVIFEHRTYLPSFGFFLIISSSIFQFTTKKNSYLAICIILVFVGMNSILTYNRNKVWRNDFTLWSDAVLKSPNKVRPICNLAVSYANNNQWDKAINYYTQAINKSRNYFIIYYNRGVAFGKLNRWNEAIADYSKSIELNPKYSLSYSNRGQAFLCLGLNENAITDFTSAIAQDNYFATAYFNRGLAYFNLEKWDESLINFDAAVNINPQFSIAYYYRGLTLEKLNKTEDAIADYSRSISFDPKFNLAYYNRGIASLNLKQYLSAISDFTKLIEIEPNNPNSYFYRAVSYGNIGQWENAVIDYDMAIKINPSYFEAIKNRTLALKNL